MENPNHKWRFQTLGKSSISIRAIYTMAIHGYVSHNQRLYHGDFTKSQVNVAFLRLVVTQKRSVAKSSETVVTSIGSIEDLAFRWLGVHPKKTMALAILIP